MFTHMFMNQNKVAWKQYKITISVGIKNAQDIFNYYHDLMGHLDPLETITDIQYAETVLNDLTNIQKRIKQFKTKANAVGSSENNITKQFIQEEFINDVLDSVCKVTSVQIRLTKLIASLYLTQFDKLNSNRRESITKAYHYINQALLLSKSNESILDHQDKLALEGFYAFINARYHSYSKILTKSANQLKIDYESKFDEQLVPSLLAIEAIKKKYYQLHNKMSYPLYISYTGKVVNTPKYQTVTLETHLALIEELKKTTDFIEYVRVYANVAEYYRIQSIHSLAEPDDLSKTLDYLEKTKEYLDKAIYYHHYIKNINYPTLFSLENELRIIFNKTHHFLRDIMKYQTQLDVIFEHAHCDAKQSVDDQYDQDSWLMYETYDWNILSNNVQYYLTIKDNIEKLSVINDTMSKINVWLVTLSSANILPISPHSNDRNRLFTHLPMHQNTQEAVSYQIGHALNKS